ncbi:MAG: zf-HC2 domain-containing protein [Candidatus Aminicenantes bacterium]|nr:zf-HC2 domain-containing protein [Candidatus Aminicenantes bacterium]
MICDRIEELLPAYRDGGLEPEEHARVEAHLRSCRGCALLLAFLGETDAALASFPQVDPAPGLRGRLNAVAGRKPLFSTVFGLLRKPALQPVLAAASVVCAVVSLYLLNPGRHELEKEIVRTFHRGIGRVEKLYARTGSITDSIGSYAENLYVSLQSINPLERNKD